VAFGFATALDWQIILFRPENVERKPRPLAQLNKDVVGCDLTRQAPAPAFTRNDVELYSKRPRRSMPQRRGSIIREKKSGSQLAVGKPESTYYIPSAQRCHPTSLFISSISYTLCLLNNSSPCRTALDI
jgi:hypothetical protein